MLCFFTNVYDGEWFGEQIVLANAEVRDVACNYVVSYNHLRW